MCGRYKHHHQPPEAMRRLFKFKNATPNLQPNYNAAPTQILPVVRLDDAGERELATLKWGLIPRCYPRIVTMKYVVLTFALVVASPLSAAENNSVKAYAKCVSREATDLLRPVIEAEWNTPAKDRTIKHEDIARAVRAGEALCREEWEYALQTDPPGTQADERRVAMREIVIEALSKTLEVQ